MLLWQSGVGKKVWENMLWQGTELALRSAGFHLKLWHWLDYCALFDITVRFCRFLMWFALSSASQNYDRNTDTMTGCQCASVPETCSEESSLPFLGDHAAHSMLAGCRLAAPSCSWETFPLPDRGFALRFYSSFCLLDGEIYHQKSTNKSHFCIWILQDSQ